MPTCLAIEAAVILPGSCPPGYPWGCDPLTSRDVNRCCLRIYHRQRVVCTVDSFLLFRPSRERLWFYHTSLFQQNCSKFYK
jgi:hypothetical protein